MYTLQNFFWLFITQYGTNKNNNGMFKNLEILLCGYITSFTLTLHIL